MSKQFIGVHGSVYLTLEQFDQVATDARRLAIVASVGLDTLQPLERLALELLRSSGHLRAI